MSSSWSCKSCMSKNTSSLLVTDTHNWSKEEEALETLQWCVTVETEHVTNLHQSDPPWRPCKPSSFPLHRSSWPPPANRNMTGSLATSRFYQSDPEPITAWGSHCSFSVLQGLDCVVRLLHVERLLSQLLPLTVIPVEKQCHNIYIYTDIHIQKMNRLKFRRVSLHFIHFNILLILMKACWFVHSKGAFPYFLYCIIIENIIWTFIYQFNCDIFKIWYQYNG